MAEEACDVSQAVRLVAMDGRVVFCEGHLEAFVPYAIELAEAFADETVESGIRPLL